MSQRRKIVEAGRMHRSLFVSLVRPGLSRQQARREWRLQIKQSTLRSKDRAIRTAMHEATVRLGLEARRERGEQ